LLLCLLIKRKMRESNGFDWRLFVWFYRKIDILLL
jgi:hypothetical protein